LDGKAGEPAKVVTKDYSYENLATGDDIMRASAIDWIKNHAKDSKPFFMYLNFRKRFTFRTILRRAGAKNRRAAETSWTRSWNWTTTVVKSFKRSKIWV
jgi:hypothetical protein